MITGAEKKGEGGLGSSGKRHSFDKSKLLCIPIFVVAKTEVN
jgi:hypothetical protein